jgi:hypothetical protein
MASGTVVIVDASCMSEGRVATVPVNYEEANLARAVDKP